MPAGVFKQRCLRLIDEVAQTHRDIVITKRGKPLAKLVPVMAERDPEAEILAGLRGRSKMLVPEREFLRPLTGEAVRDLDRRAR